MVMFISCCDGERLGNEEKAEQEQDKNASPLDPPSNRHL
jgi:hypothetical protein